jgi:hypothetical protein
MNETLPIGRESFLRLCIDSEWPCSDCTTNNMMFAAPRMDPNGFHRAKIDRNRNFITETSTRTQRPPIYYLVDFGLSRQYASRDALDEPVRGGDKSAPEHRSQGRCNPFQTDIYYLGNLVRQEFMQVRSPPPEYPFTRLISSSKLEISRFWIHGGFDQLDDSRRSYPTPFNRRRDPELH